MKLMSSDAVGQESHHTDSKHEPSGDDSITERSKVLSAQQMAKKHQKWTNRVIRVKQRKNNT